MATEKRLIDAHALIEAINFEYDLNYGEILIDPVRFAGMVEDAPTVYAVEVVRCKNCRYYNTDGEYCGFWGACRHPEHYCEEGVSNDV